MLFGDPSCGPTWIKKSDEERATRLGEVEGYITDRVKSRCRRDEAERM